MNKFLYDYCDVCGKRIEIGDTCYNLVDGRTLCTDCCKQVNTLYEFELSSQQIGLEIDKK